MTAEIENKSYQHIKSKIAVIETVKLDKCLYKTYFIECVAQNSNLI